ncbi:DapH/DapD/GlmU-related protein [Francisella noatunensis]
MTIQKYGSFVVILSDAIIGENCDICSHCLIENEVFIGNNVTIKSGVQIWDGITLEDNVFISGCKCDIYKCPKPFAQMHYANKVAKNNNMKKGPLSTNSTICPGMTIGENAMIGAGFSCCSKMFPANEIWIGNPAKFYKKV